MNNLLQTQYFRNGSLYCKFNFQGLFTVNFITKETMSMPLSDCSAMLLSMNLSECRKIDEYDFVTVWDDALAIYN